MLSKRQRLSGREVAYILNKGSFVSKKDVFLKILPHAHSFPRVAVVISKKVYRKATDRNKLKRQIISLLEPVFDRQEISSKIVIVIKKPLPAEELVNQIGQCLQKSSKA